MDERTSVARWLAGLGLERHAERFARNQIAWEDLPLLTPMDLREDLAIESLADRRKLLAAIDALRPRPDARVPAIAPDPRRLAALPFPVAYPWHFALATDLPAADRLQNLVLAAYQALRLTALVLLADYLDAGAKIAAVDVAIRQSLRQPHWFDWTRLAKSCPATRFPALVEGWRTVSRRAGARADELAALYQGLPGNQGNATSANEALWRARNDLAHRRTTRTRDDSRDSDRLSRLLPLLDRVLDVLFGAASLQLVRRASADPASDRVFVLEGPHPDLTFTATAAPPAAREVLARSPVVVAGADFAVPLHPLAAPLDGPSGECDLGLVDGASERRIVLLGVRQNKELEDLAPAFFEALARRGIDLGASGEDVELWNLHGWSRRTAREALEGVKGRKYLPDLYVERNGVDDVVESWLAKPGRALLVVGEAGAGKSSLLARLVHRALSERDDESGEHARVGEEADSGDVVLYLPGRSAWIEDAPMSGALLLADAIARQAGVKRGEFTELASLLGRLEAHRELDVAGGRRLLLVIDGLDEAPRVSELVAALDGALPCVARHPWLRLVVSLRTGAYHALAQRSRLELARGREVFANERYLASFEGDETGVPYLELRPFTDAEMRRAYEQRQANRPERSCSVEFGDLPASVRQLLRTPLQLHLFHEAYQGRDTTPAQLDERRLFGDVLETAIADAPALRDTLDRIGGFLFEERRGDVSSEEAERIVADWRAPLKAVNRVGRLDPIEELHSASILGRPVESRRAVAYPFTHAALAEQVLRRELQRRIEPRGLPRGPELLEWARRAAGQPPAVAPFPLLLGALERVVADLVRAGEGEALGRLLELEDTTARARLLDVALRALGEAWGSSEEGTLAAREVLARLVQAAEADLARAEAFAVESSEPARRLARSGGSRATAAIAGVRVRLLSRLVEAHPERAPLRQELAHALTQHGRVFLDDKARRAEARPPLESARKLLLELTRDSAVDRALAYVIGQLAILADRLGERHEAWELSRQGQAILERLAREHPEDTGLRRDLAFVLN